MSFPATARRAGSLTRLSGRTVPPGASPQANSFTDGCLSHSFLLHVPPIPKAEAGNATVACRSLSGYSPAMNDWQDCPAIERDPERVSGAWVFRGTRVPVRALFENLEDGATVDDFLEWFPGVLRSQVEAVLKHAESSLLAPA